MVTCAFVVFAVNMTRQRYSNLMDIYSNNYFMIIIIFPLAFDEFLSNMTVTSATIQKLSDFDLIIGRKLFLSKQFLCRNCSRKLREKENTFKYSRNV
jgi:hypothetical protein